MTTTERTECSILRVVTMRIQNLIAAIGQVYPSVSAVYVNSLIFDGTGNMILVFMLFV